MNKRQKKKLYKRKMGKNPPKEMKFFEKNYHEAISKPQNKKTAKYIPGIHQQQILKGWNEFKVTVERAAEALRKLFYAVGIMTSEITLSSYDKNTENIVNLTKVLTKQRKVRRG